MCKKENVFGLIINDKNGENGKFFLFRPKMAKLFRFRYQVHLTKVDPSPYGHFAPIFSKYFPQTFCKTPFYRSKIGLF